jgi:hypothetical protein
MKEGDIYDIGQTVNGVSRFLYLDNNWYYARSLVMRYNYDESELTRSVISLKIIPLDEDDSVELIGNIFTDDDLVSGLDFSKCSEVLGEIREKKLKDLGI